MKAVILAAGKGVRMRQVSLGLPKILLPLGRGNIGDNAVQGLNEAGVSELLIVVGHMEEQIKEHFRDGSSLGVAIHYVRQDRQLGTGHAASLARDFVAGEPFFILAYGDIATPPENYSALLDDFRKHSPEASLSVYPVEDPSKGAAVYVEGGYMKCLVEKPGKGISTTRFDNAGLYIFTPKVFEMLGRVGLSPRGEYELTDALTLLVESGSRVRAHELSGFWSNVTSPEDLLQVNGQVIDRMAATHLLTVAVVPHGAEVSPLSVLHSGAKVGRCFIGPYTVVAGGAKIMDEARVSHTVVCRDAVVGRRAVLDHVLVRPRCAVKPGKVHRGTRDRVLILPDEG